MQKPTKHRKPGKGKRERGQALHRNPHSQCKGWPVKLYAKILLNLCMCRESNTKSGHELREGDSISKSSCSSDCEVWSRSASTSSPQPGASHQLPQPTSPTQHSHCWGPEEACAQSHTHKQRGKAVVKAVQSILFWKAFVFKKPQKSMFPALFYFFCLLWTPAYIQSVLC